jgi:hypothetical protein
MNACASWRCREAWRAKLHTQQCRQFSATCGGFARFSRESERVQIQRLRLGTSTKPRCLITFRTGVFFRLTVIRLLSIFVGTASSTPSARERDVATCEAGAWRNLSWTLVTFAKTPKFGAVRPPKQRHTHSVGSSELEIHPQPFLHSHSHSPAPHLAIEHLRG